MGTQLAARNITAASLAALYEKHGSTLAAYLCCRGVEFASAEDAVQQLFLKLMQANVSMPGDRCLTSIELYVIRRSTCAAAPGERLRWTRWRTGSWKLRDAQRRL
jgi:hypothetical protein